MLAAARTTNFASRISPGGSRAITSTAITPAPTRTITGPPLDSSGAFEACPLGISPSTIPRVLESLLHTSKTLSMRKGSWMFERENFSCLRLHAWALLYFFLQVWQTPNYPPEMSSSDSLTSAAIQPPLDQILFARL